MNAAVESPRIRFEADELHIEFAPLFGSGGEAQARRFVRRTFAFPEVRSIHLDPGAGKSVVRYQIAGYERKSFLASLAAAIGSSDEGLDDARLPGWRSGEPVSLHRFGEVVSTFEISPAGPGRLQFRHAAISHEPGLGRRMENAVKSVAGVKQAVATGSTGRLWVSYQPEATDILRLIRVAEVQLASPRTALATLSPAPAELGLANAALGLAAVGEFALPVVMPVCVGILLVSNLGTIRQAGQQLGRGKLGLPVLYTALLGCSITTGQIVAHALMEWSFRFWAGRSNSALVEECRNLFEDNLPLPAQARLVRSNEVDARVPSDLLRAGHHIRLEGADAIPADGCVVAGNALVDEISVRGARSPVRKSVGDEVFAGSTVLAGNIEVEVVRTGPQTQAALIARSVMDSARALTRDPNLSRRSDALADRTVSPTLAVAGVGWVVGDLFTVGAVLHQDYASGPKLAVPMETLRSMSLALRSGTVVRSGSALPRLAESRFVVLDDHPAWMTRALELEGLDSRLAGSEANNLLRHVAGAGFYLGDARAQALLNACSGLGLVVRVPALVTLDAGKVTVRQGRHTITLRNEIAGDEVAATPVLVEIDGEEVARLRFRLSELPFAARAVRQLRQKGMQVFVLSSRPEQETADLARRLGADLCSGDFTRDEKIRFLRGLRKRGVRATYIGNGQIDPELAGEAHVSVSLGGTAALSAETTDIVLLGDTLGAFEEVVDLAQGYNERIRATCRHSLLPNLLCIAGGYAGVLNGITAGLLANVGVYSVYKQATGSLRASQRPAGFKRVSV